ncbi:hypothetical protein [Sweet potato vein clearing virus]|uniref:Uncharacterized protein n=1 Tax=Sweet potato vein clearing virus TaxID=995049 RepID=F2XXZ0_9VIRU|nr:hypothetical protein SPVCVp4 [Sweet potato vein clearing virus]ADZ45061.1 hypothetical protein [Sweet potato vein clearing virus]
MTTSIKDQIDELNRNLSKICFEILDNTQLIIDHFNIRKPVVVEGQTSRTTEDVIKEMNELIEKMYKKK